MEWNVEEGDAEDGAEEGPRVGDEGGEADESNFSSWIRCCSVNPLSEDFFDWFFVVVVVNVFVVVADEEVEGICADCCGRLLFIDFSSVFFLLFVFDLGFELVVVPAAGAVEALRVFTL